MKSRKFYNAKKRSSSVPLKKKYYNSSEDNSSDDSKIDNSADNSLDLSSDSSADGNTNFRTLDSLLLPKNQNSIQKPQGIISRCFVIGSFVRISLILVLFVISLAIFQHHMQINIEDSRNSISGSNIPVTNISGTIPQQHIDWWGRYSRYCCVLTNNTGIYSRISGDCSANGICNKYLNHWLKRHNQTFWISSWSRQCCYTFSPIDAQSMNIYCSYPCLNTKRTEFIDSKK
jgi:hypothetical protein